MGVPPLRSYAGSNALRVIGRTALPGANATEAARLDGGALELVSTRGVIRPPMNFLMCLIPDFAMLRSIDFSIHGNHLTPVNPVGAISQTQRFVVQV